MVARTPVARAGHRSPGRRELRCAGDRRSRWQRREQADAGAVTVEAALALCSLAVFLAVAVTSVVAVAAAIRCIDAAREMARLAARGEADRGRAVAAELAPTGARLELVHRDDLVIAEVSHDLLRPLPLRVGGRAVAALEPGDVGS
ncbi:hypothetical protein GCM10010464_63350 [Pseudonocardia yunnanensis]|uniref:TadE family type IV pilus minor pilin n=1 Tax=Pseudonocardia yunnanensis TaxID=58107 RepID=A0ABW4ET71_9PSEU